MYCNNICTVKLRNERWILVQYSERVSCQDFYEFKDLCWSVCLTCQFVAQGRLRLRNDFVEKFFAIAGVENLQGLFSLNIRHCSPREVVTK